MTCTASSIASTHSPMPVPRGAQDRRPGDASPAIASMMALRTTLLRYAQRRLQDPLMAEDVVHDVYEAVLSGRARFEGRSSLRSWLIGILKHKIVDLIRERVRWVGLATSTDDADDEAEASITESLWSNAQINPQDCIERRQRLTQALARIDTMPTNLREVMRLRVLQDLSTTEVCNRLGISEDNLFVRLHRARKLLCQ